MIEDSSKELFSWMKVIFLTVLIVLAARQFVFEPVEVHGKSMMPTFKEEDKIILAKISTIQNFDLIVFSVANDKNYLKRVIGIPGDRVKMEDDQLYLNGKPVEEPYLEKNLEIARQLGYPKLTEDFAEFTVPSGTYFVLGDNRLNSVDSRMIGAILEDAVIGEVKLRLSPIEHIGIVE